MMLYSQPLVASAFLLQSAFLTRVISFQVSVPLVRPRATTNTQNNGRTQQPAHVQNPSSRSGTISSPFSFQLYNSLKPAALPLMDSGKALARSGELLIEVTTALDLYGGALSAAGAEVRNCGDAIAQAAASMRFKTGLELVTDELRESGTCLQEASQKIKLAKEEAQQDDLSQDIIAVLEQMQMPFLTSGKALEAAGAGIMQKASISAIGSQLEQAGTQLSTVASLIPQLLVVEDGNKDNSAALSGQRLAFAAEKMIQAGQDLQGIKPKAAGGKSWLKGGGGI